MVGGNVPVIAISIDIPSDGRCPGVMPRCEGVIPSVILGPVVFGCDARVSCGKDIVGQNYPVVNLNVTYNWMMKSTLHCRAQFVTNLSSERVSGRGDDLRRFGRHASPTAEGGARGAAPSSRRVLKQ